MSRDDSNAADPRKHEDERKRHRERWLLGIGASALAAVIFAAGIGSCHGLRAPFWDAASNIDYADGFGRRHWTTFSAFYNRLAPGDKSKSFSFCAHGNDAR